MLIFARPRGLTDCASYDTLAKPTRPQSIYETHNLHPFYLQYIQIPKRIQQTNKRQFYIYKHI